MILLAFRNLTRYSRRTMITSSAIAFGLMLFFLFDSLIIGVQVDSERNLRAYETSHLRIMHSDYWNNRLTRPLDIALEESDDLVTRLQENGYRAARRVRFLADMILSSAEFGEDGNIAVDVVGYDPEQDFDVFGFESTLIEGRFPLSGADEVFIGSWLAEDIGAEVGAYISLVTRGRGGFFEVMDLEIVGIVNCPNPNVNRTLLMVPYQTVNEYLALEESATEINIRLSDYRDAEAERVRIEELVGSYEVMTWTELGADYFAFAAADEGGADIMIFFVFIITAVGISNTMLMSVQERTRELGMVRALGMKSSSIRFLFMLEAGGIGLAGTFAGIAAGSILNIFLVRNGIDFSFIMRDMDMGYRVSGVMRGVWSPVSFAVTAATGIFLPMVFALIPVHRALRKDIPGCLHHQ